MTGDYQKTAERPVKMLSEDDNITNDNEVII